MVEQVRYEVKVTIPDCDGKGKTIVIRETESIDIIKKTVATLGGELGINIDYGKKGGD